MANIRQQLSIDDLKIALKLVEEKLIFRSEQKGMGSFASNHEIFGVLTQELSEYEDAIHKRLSSKDKMQELMDIAVGAIFGIASINGNGVDW